MGYYARLLEHYHDVRRENPRYGAKTALGIARDIIRLDAKVRELETVHGHPLGYDWESMAYTMDDGTWVMVSATQDHEPTDLGDWGRADGWPMAERATYYRDHEGMSRGVAWETARRDWQQDKDREDDWRTMIVRVDVETVGGGQGSAILGGVDYLESEWSWSKVWREVMYLAEDMLGEAMDEARADEHAKAMRKLPPMLRRPLMVA
jgi:hypothetical protein